MKTTSLRTRALACALLAIAACCGLAAGPARAQTAREHRALDSNGVDLTHGDFVMAFAEGSIGSGDGELALVRNRIGSGNGSWHVSSGGHQWDGLYLTRSGGSGSAISVTKDSRYERFSATGTLPTGSSLTEVGAQHHYRIADGTLVVFGDPSASTASTSPYCNGSDGQGPCTQLPLSIATPDGRSVDIAWEIMEACLGDLVDVDHPLDCSYWARIGSVSNSFGYRIAFTYEIDGNSNSNGAPPPDGWQRRTRARFYNDTLSTDHQAEATYDYPSTGIVEVTDIGGRQWRFTGSGLNITAIRRPGAPADTTTVSYAGPSGTVSSVTHEGVTTNYSRSVSGSLATMTITDALDGESRVRSDLTIGRPTSVTNPLDRTTSYQFDGSGRLKRVTAPEGNYVEYIYDGRGNVTRTERVAKSGSGLAAITTHASYESGCSNPITCNRPNSTTDALGNVTDYTYHPIHGGVLTATAPAPIPGGVRPQVRYSYTLANGEYRLSGISACQTASACAGTADEVRTTIAWDPNGNVTSTSTGAGDGSLVAPTSMSYDPIGNLLTVDGPLSGNADTSHIRYDDARQVVGTISADPDGAGPLRRRAARITYTDGLPTKVEQGNVDGPSDLDWAAFAPWQEVQTSHDANARPTVSRLVASGTTYALTQTGYDTAGRPECVARRMNPAGFGSLPADACAPGTEGSYGPDRIVRTVHDAAGQVTRVQSAVGTSVQADEVVSTYTGNGLVRTVKDGENNLTTYEYDGHNRLLNIRYPLPAQGANASAPTGGAGADFEHYGYDSGANVTSFRNRAGETIGFTYDALGRRSSKDLPGGELDVSYGYDLLGRMTSAATSAQTLAFAWDALGRNVSQTDGARTYWSAYDLAGRRTRLTHPDGFFVDQDYLVTGELTKIRENGATSGVGLLATYGYDDLGRRSSLVFGNGESASYQYDAVSRLSQLVRDLGGTANDLTLTFAYNPASQIVSTTRSNPGSGPGQADLYAWTGHGSGSTGTAANGLNQLASWNGALAYDAKGNMTSDGTRSYSYDSENRLSPTAPSLPYRYDPLGRLAGAGAPIAVHYENYVDGLIAERLAGSPGVSFRHVFGPGSDEPLVWYNGPGTSDRRFLHADERGSIVAVTDGSANLLAINRYDEYGRTQSTSPTHQGRFLYTGQRYFNASGLYHYKARFYHPTVGRFMQADPIGYGGGMNLYAYVGGDPVNLTDPLGLQACENGACGDIVIGGGRGRGAGFGLGAAARFQLDEPIEFAGSAAPGEITIIITAPERLVPPALLKCRGPARILQGNTNLVGRTGGFGPEMPVRLGSAAVIPRQFTGEPNAGPLMRSIGKGVFGWTDTGQSFFGFTDTIDHNDLAPRARLAQDMLMVRDPDRLILEIVGAARDERTSVTLIIPSAAGCPDHTSQTGSFP